LKNLPSGSFASEGLDDEHKLLTTDIRPFGSDTSWFLLIDFGDSPSRVRLDWGSVQLPVEKPLNIVEVDPFSDFNPIVNTSVDMLRNNSLEINENELTGRKVFLIGIGSVSESRVMTLLPGWNLVSLPVAPVNPSPDAVFSNNTGKIFAGAIWGFGLTTIGQTVQSYFEVNEVKAGQGYWVFVNRTSPVTIALNGSSVSNSLSLEKDWNLIGIPTLRNALVPGNIRGQTNLPFQPVQFWNPLLGMDGEYEPGPSEDRLSILQILKGYWMYSPVKQVISLELAP